MCLEPIAEKIKEILQEKIYRNVYWKFCWKNLLKKFIEKYTENIYRKIYREEGGGLRPGPRLARGSWAGSGLEILTLLKSSNIFDTFVANRRDNESYITTFKETFKKI